MLTIKAVWRNGIASDYESGDCRFDPCDGHKILHLWEVCLDMFFVFLHVFLLFL